MPYIRRVEQQKQNKMTTEQMVSEVKKVVGEMNEDIIIDAIIDFSLKGTSDELIIEQVVDEIFNNFK